MRYPLWLAALAALVAGSGVRAADNTPPEGFTALFNGKDFAGWHGMGHFDPYKLAAMTDAERAEKRAKDLVDLNQHWKVEAGELVNDGHGVYLTTDAPYGDVELFVDYKMLPKGDSGIYLRATPQVQIWDFTEEGGKWKLGADKGSGGLWNNRAGKPGKDPLVLADKKFGEWNTFRIVQVGARTSVWLNDKLVVDHAVLENFWDKDRKLPLIASAPIQLQTHGSEIRWKNVYVRPIPATEANEILAKHESSGFAPIFDGKSFDGWKGPTENYDIVEGAVRCKPSKGGTIYRDEELTDFVARVEFKLPAGGNNGLAIRYPGTGDTAYVGMTELQVLDDSSPKYAKLDPRQVHGSAYGMAPAVKGYQRPVGEWNFQEVTVKGSTIKVELNGSVILDADLSTITEYMGKSPHPGKERTSGFFGFAGHGDAVEFRNVSVKKL
ncbi:MAG: DUF1080 domain-containing protein [Planctomycetia bacterium]|nr:DUF1080 domain-containing protein [Planctomycetia bacterium]